jgi:hypothetical protein
MPSARVTLVSDIFRQYLDALREFEGVLEQCSLKGWPDKKNALRTAFRIQELFYEQMRFRLDHLLQSSASDDAIWKRATISSVHERLEAGWKDTDEALLRKNQSYAAVQKEIEDLRAVLDSAGLVGPFKMVKRDPELLAAGNAFDKRFRDLERRLSVQL